MQYRMKQQIRLVRIAKENLTEQNKAWKITEKNGMIILFLT